LFYYETIKLITITNWKMGVVHRSIQVIIILYIAFYAIWYNAGYQKSSPVEGVLYTKVKGVAVDQYGQVYDSGDLVQPAVEANALFVATQYLQTFQSEDSFCPDSEAPCTNNTSCVPGTFTINGQVQPNCDLSGACTIKGWCPVENPAAPITQLSRIPNWTVFMRTDVTYTAFTSDNTANNANKAQLGYNIFSFYSLLPSENWTSMEATGGIIEVKIDWSCNLDLGVGKCLPTFFSSAGRYCRRCFRWI